MGVRIVVVFQSDLAHVWGQDTNLGKRILSHAQGIHHLDGAEIEGGRVVEVIDDSIQSVLITDRYKVHCLAYERYHPGQGRLASCVRLLRTAARNLGYNLFRNYLRPVRLPEGPRNQ